MQLEQNKVTVGEKPDSLLMLKSAHKEVEPKKKRLVEFLRTRDSYQDGEEKGEGEEMEQEEEQEGGEV